MIEKYEPEKKDYWATNCELFARAGAAMVTDKLDQLGIYNNYLVSGAEDNRIFFRPNGNGSFSPNPLGKERKFMSAEIEKLIDEFKNELRPAQSEEITPGFLDHYHKKDFLSIKILTKVKIYDIIC